MGSETDNLIHVQVQAAFLQIGRVKHLKKSRALQWGGVNK